MYDKKYPRTPHLKWSQSLTSDDIYFSGDFTNKEIVITEKLDGENTGMTNKSCHARSLDSRDHDSRHWVKQLHSFIKNDIPDKWKIFGENMFAYHSILYIDLPSYFLSYSIYNEKNICLSWDETVEFCELIGLTTVPVIYRGVYNPNIFSTIWTGKGSFPTYESSLDEPKNIIDFQPSSAEGYVVRTADSFEYENFSKNVAKFVRKNHVKPNTGHWASKQVFQNLLKV